MRLFKKKETPAPLKTGWEDLTVKDVLEIKGIAELQLASEDEKNLRVASLLAGMDYDKMTEIPLDEVRKYMDNTDFLLSAPKHSKVKRHYYVNGRKYRLLRNPIEMTVAQYLDFQAVWRDGFDKKPAEMLSIFLVPDGHEYNDGYDKDQVKEDMYDMPIVEGLGIADFFTGRLAKSIRLGLTFCRWKMKWLRLTARKKDKEMYRALETEMNLVLDELECIYGSPALKR